MHHETKKNWRWFTAFLRHLVNLRFQVPKIAHQSQWQENMDIGNRSDDSKVKKHKKFCKTAINGCCESNLHTRICSRNQKFQYCITIVQDHTNRTEYAVAFHKASSNFKTLKIAYLYIATSAARIHKNYSTTDTFI